MSDLTPTDLTPMDPPAGARRPLRECARMIRARNAGSYLISIDVAFDDAATYERCRDGDVFDVDTIAALYGVPAGAVAVIAHDPSRAIKVTLPRQFPSGHPRDPDIDSSQQYVPLLALTVPVAS